jgi:integrase
MPAPLPFAVSEWPAADRRLPKYLTQDQVSRFFASITNVRDQALFALIYLYGLRVGEVPLHQRADVDFARKRIVIRRLKHGVWSERPLFSRVEELLVRYFDQFPNARPELFPGRLGPLRKRQIQARFTRYRIAAGIPAFYGCHSLRHSIATHLLDAELPLEFVQDHLGHRDIRSTSIYARITTRRREEVFRGLESSPWIVQPNLGGG